jgi:hypothetical protein
VTKLSNKEKLLDLEIKIKLARINGAMYHPTNPIDAWYCDCGVFGRGRDTECWACGRSENELFFQWIPRFGGGAQTTGPYEE